MIAPPPPKVSELLSGHKLVSGLSFSTVLADLDFETYSEAGFVWDDNSQKYKSPPGSNRKGLPCVGMAVYAQHPSTEVLSVAYNLKDGKGVRHWKPGQTPPSDLLEHVKSGKLIEAWNSAFEFWIWNNVCVRCFDWPCLVITQMRCAAAKSRAFGLPGHLADAGSVLNTVYQKDKDGKRLLTKFSMPRNPTKNNPYKRI